jgi:hypothetical protein
VAQSGNKWHRGFLGFAGTTVEDWANRGYELRSSVIRLEPPRKSFLTVSAKEIAIAPDARRARRQSPSEHAAG